VGISRYSEFLEECPDYMTPTLTHDTAGNSTLTAYSGIPICPLPIKTTHWKIFHKNVIITNMNLPSPENSTYLILGCGRKIGYTCFENHVCYMNSDIRHNSSDPNDSRPNAAITVDIDWNLSPDILHHLRKGDTSLVDFLKRNGYKFSAIIGCGLIITDYCKELSTILHEDGKLLMYCGYYQQIVKTKRGKWVTLKTPYQFDKEKGTFREICSNE
jgi:hypothetical protein